MNYDTAGLLRSIFAELSNEDSSSLSHCDPERALIVDVVSSQSHVVQLLLVICKIQTEKPFVDCVSRE